MKARESWGLKGFFQDWHLVEGDFGLAKGLSLIIKGIFCLITVWLNYIVGFFLTIFNKTLFKKLFTKLIPHLFHMLHIRMSPSHWGPSQPPHLKLQPAAYMLNPHSLLYFFLWSPWYLSPSNFFIVFIIYFFIVTIVFIVNLFPLLECKLHENIDLYLR